MLKSQMKKLPRQGAVKKIGDREICNVDSAEGRRIYGDRLQNMCLRQGMVCAICRNWHWVMQFDHQDGRGMGGKHRTDAIYDAMGRWINAALCPTCNVLKGSKRYKWVNGVYREVKKFQEVA